MKDKQKIGRQEVIAAREILRRYKQGKANLENRIVENEQWYKMRHWECMRRAKTEVEPASGWLFNAIANKHADAMDNIPAANILPREQEDRPEAEALSAIVPVVLEQNDFETVYHKLWDHKLRSGTGVYGIFWDKNKLGGLGDIHLQRVDVLNLFWEGGITDIQESRNLFHVVLLDDDLLIADYPRLKGKLGGEGGELSKYLYDDTVDLSGKSAVVDWYYKKGGKLHYCKFVNDEVLFSSENEGMDSWYDHGMYPFVFDPLFSVEGTPCGFGYIDVGKSAQEYIDRGNQAILQNLLANARPRHFIRNDGSVNEQEYADMTRDFVHVDGALGRDSILPITGTPLAGIYVEVIQSKIDELKEVTGNRDISTGGTASGVTAASAIAAMQEAGSKLSRDHNKASYRAFRNMVMMVIELIRQFYDLPRVFRITGADGVPRFESYSNARIRGRKQEGGFGVDLGLRLPVFDVAVTAQRKSPYSRMSQNELALQFYNAGFFDPNNSEQALACLDMMDFDGKTMVMNRLQERAQASLVQREVAAIMAAGGIAGNGQSPSQADRLTAPFTQGGLGAGAKRKPLVLKGEKGESYVTKNARQRVAESTAPT